MIINLIFLTLQHQIKLSGNNRKTLSKKIISRRRFFISCWRLQSNFEKIKCWKYPSNKSEEVKVLILNPLFWLFYLIFSFQKNQWWEDGWFFENEKIRWKNQKSMLGINGLDAADFLKEVLITLEDKNNFLLEEFGQKTIYVRNSLSWLSAGIKRFNFQLISMTT